MDEPTLIITVTQLIWMYILFTYLGGYLFFRRWYKQKHLQTYAETGFCWLLSPITMPICLTAVCSYYFFTFIGWLLFES